MKTKKFDVGIVKMDLLPNGFVKGFALKRDASVRECKHIMKNILGIDFFDRDCFEDQSEYKEFNENLVHDVNAWLRGEFEDTALMEEYAPDCSDEPIGVMCLVPVIPYLKKKGIID